MFIYCNTLAENKRKNAVIIISTFPDEESALCLSKRMVEKKLCACVSFIKVRSVYNWKGALQVQPEFMALFKTTKKSSAKLKAALAHLHPYEIPEIIELQLSDISKSYFSWLVAESADWKSKKRNDSPKRRDA